MAERPARYERIGEGLSAQSRRNIGEGRVLAGMRQRGELPFDTTLADARVFDLDLSARPRKGKRKKGLLPELTKKEYRLQLGIKVKDFSKEERSIYNALAKRESRGYVPNRQSDTSIAEELEDFLLEEDELPSGGGGSVVATIEDVLPEAPTSIEDLLATLPDADELPDFGLEELPDFFPPPQEVKIPQGISSKVAVANPTVETSSEEESEYEDDDTEFISMFDEERAEEIAPTKKRPSRKNPLLLSNKELREYTSDPTLSIDERGRRVNEVNLGYVRLDKEKAKAEREAQKIRQKEQRRIDAETRQREIEEEAEALFTQLEENSRLAELARRDRIVEETMRKVREENRRIDEEIAEAQRKKPIPSRSRAPPTPVEEEEEDFLSQELDELLGETEEEEEFGGFPEIIDAPPDPEDLSTDEDTTDEESEEDFLEAELDELLPDTPPKPPTPKPPTPVVETTYKKPLSSLPKIPKKKRIVVAQSPTPSPTYQPPTPDNSYLFGSPNTPIQFDSPTREDLGIPSRLATTPNPDTRLLFQLRKPTPTPPRIPRQARATTTPIFARERLQEAGVGNLSLGGATQRYRLLDFEVRPIPNVPPSKSQPVFQQLLKNNKARRKK